MAPEMRESKEIGFELGVVKQIFILKCQARH